MGSFPVEFSTTTADRFESFPVYIIWRLLRRRTPFIEAVLCDLAESFMIVLVLN